MSEIEEHVLSLARTKGVLRGSDLEAEGIPRQYLYRLYDK
ncbi:MAG: transcriptional regulator, partial [Bacteroidetes bacterium]|nr:transcriptional regulator [Bacteroidota bacterium]